MKYFVSAGEASGDIHGAQLVRAIMDKDPDAQVTFLGGDGRTLQTSGDSD